MNRVHRLFAPAAAVLVATTLATTLAPAPANAATADRRPAEFETIRPGEEVVVDSPIRVNIVMVGYEPDSFDVDRLIGGLPPTSRPVVRAKGMWYGIHDEVGLEHRYQYVPRFAGAEFDNAFFDHLAKTGSMGPAAPTAQWYNDQEHNVLEVPSEFLHLDAVATERWLEKQAAKRLGVDPADHTVFLVNWWGRPDFQFHVYQATGDPDPDTGIEPGLEPWAHLISWGGSTGRSWFLDLSAGPEYWQAGFDVDHADITGDGRTDDRLPPVWEYGNTAGYRPFDDLEGDLSKAIRHVAINALFTGSPLYDPTHYVPAPGGARVFDINLFEGDPAQNGLELIKPDVIRDQFAALAPYVDTEVTVTDRPLTDDERRTLHIAGGALQEDDCWNQFGYQLAQLSCWFSARAEQYWPSAAPGDAVVRGLAFTLTDEDSWAFGFPGVAEDNYVDGTPTVFAVNDSPSYRSVYGAHTHGTLHSGGHMLGLSHGHDGYDAEQGQMHGLGGQYYMWLGSGVQSPMSKLFTHTRFGVFDRDNLDRWMVGGLLNRANADTEVILQSASSGDREVLKLLRQADKTFGRSLDAFAKGEWDRAAALAVKAYDDVQRAGARAGTTNVKDSHDRYAGTSADAPEGGRDGRDLEEGRQGSTSPGTPRHPCHVPADVNVDPAALPPGCARAAAAPASESARYCSLASPGAPAPRSF